MRQTIRPIPTLLLVVGLGLPLLVACSSESDRPPAGGGGGGGGIGSSGTLPTSDAGGDGSTLADGGAEAGPALCDPNPVVGDTVQELAIKGDAPDPLGGPIADGTYVATEYNAYGAAATGLSGFHAHGSLIVAGNTIEIVGARGLTAEALPPNTILGVSFVAAGMTLATTPVCPSAGAVKNIPYSAVGGGIALFTDTTHRVLYTKR